jgi:hypothetical protein
MHTTTNGEQEIGSHIKEGAKQLLKAFEIPFVGADHS